MSHTLTSSQNPVLLGVSLTIIDYAVGGETVPPSELNFGSIVGVVFANVPPAQNSLGIVLIPVLSSGKILLIRDSAGVLQEIPATVGLNAHIFAIVHAQGLTL